VFLRYFDLYHNAPRARSALPTQFFFHQVYSIAPGTPPEWTVETQGRKPSGLDKFRHVGNRTLMHKQYMADLYMANFVAQQLHKPVISTHGETTQSR